MVVKRAHTAANRAPALVTALDQFNALWPLRDKSSDGFWPSAAHTAANPTSDHEAGNALDIDDDLSAYWDVWAAALTIANSKDGRVKYLIHDDRIWSLAGGWRDYSGSNPHRTHLHISVWEAKRNDARLWSIGGTDMLPLDYLNLSITDLGDGVHRTALVAIAKSHGLEFREATNTFYVDAKRGHDGIKGLADEFIDYAAKYGLDCGSIPTYKGQAAMMVVRLKGMAAPIDAACAAENAELKERIGAAIDRLEGKG